MPSLAFLAHINILQMLKVRDSIPDIYFIITSEPALGLTQCCVQSFDRRFFSGKKRPVRETVH
jgi:hypothetical protein